LFAILRKDLMEAIVNLRLLVFIVAPLLMSILFGLLFGDLRASEVPVGLSSRPGPAVVVPVYDAGESQIVRLLHDSETYDVRQMASPEQVIQALVQDRLSAGLVLPQGFDAALMQGQYPRLQVLVNAQQPDGSAVLCAWLAHTLWDRMGQTFPSAVVVETLAAEIQGPLTQRQEHMALWLVMSLVAVGVYVVPALLVEEKQARTLEMILIAPLRHEAVVAAKAGVGLVYGLLSAGVILALSGGLASDPGWVAAVVVLGAVVLVELGLLLGGLLDNMAALNTWSTPLMLLLMLPGMVYGLLTSGLFRLASLERLVALLPTHHLLRATYTALSGRGGIESMARDVGLLAGAAVFLFLLNVALLRRQQI